MEETKRSDKTARYAAIYTVMTLALTFFMIGPIAYFLLNIPIPFIRRAAFKYIMEYTIIGNTDIFYSGLVDYSVNFVRHTQVCRHINVREALKLAHNSTIYLIVDGAHLRTYVNGTIVDIVAPDVKMDRKNLRILKCDIEYIGLAYSSSCRTIYYYPYVDPDYEDKVYSILSALDNYENKYP